MNDVVGLFVLHLNPDAKVFFYSAIVMSINALFPPLERQGTVYTIQLGRIVANSGLCIPRNETARPRSQFLHSCICERFLYCQDRSAYLAATQ